MISVFVSSTFRDMQGERDILRQEVLPEIRSFCTERGENISLVDLRWGVDTSRLSPEDQSRKVLNVCLDQIDRCKPYMIVMIGQRYGWVPEDSLIRSVVSSKNYRDDGTSRSVTALEIEYGTLSAKENADKYLFFFREDLPLDRMPDEYRKDFGPESPFHAARLKELKEKITGMFPDRVFTYRLNWDGNRLSGYEEFGRAVTSCLKTILQRSVDGKAARTKSEKRLRTHLRLAEEQQLRFAERGQLVREVTALAAENHLILLPGAAGTGKTALMCKMAAVLKDSGYTVIPVFCGTTADTASSRNVMELIVDVLEDLCGAEDHYDSLHPAGLRFRWSNLADRFCATGRKLAILLDGLDRLVPDELAAHLNFLPQQISDSCTILVTCRDSYELPRHFTYRTAIRCVSDAEIGETVGIITHLAALQAKEMDAKSRLALLTEKKSSVNPLYLSFLLRRLINMDNEDFRGIAQQGNDMAAISAYITGLIRQSPDNLDGIVRSFCEEVIRHVAPVQTQKVLQLIALSSRGLRQDHLQGIFAFRGWNWSELDFARMQKYMYGFIAEREQGRFDFAYPEFRPAILSGTDPLERQELRRVLLDFLKVLPDEDLAETEDVFRLACEADDQQAAAAYLNRLGQPGNTGAAVQLAHSVSRCLVSGGDEWFGRLLANGINFGAQDSLVRFITDFLLPDLYSSGISNTITLNLGEAVSWNTRRLAVALNERVSADMQRKYGSADRVTAGNTNQVLDILRDQDSAARIGFTLGKALAAAAGYCELQGDYSTALDYSCEALVYHQNLYRLHPDDESRVPFANLLVHTGKLFLRFGLNNGAAALGQKAIALCNEYRIPAGIGKNSAVPCNITVCRICALDLLSQAAPAGKDLQAALDYSQRAVKTCREFAAETDLFTAYETLSDLYEQRGILLQEAGDLSGAAEAFGNSGELIPKLSAFQDYYRNLRRQALHALHTGGLLFAGKSFAEAAKQAGWSIQWFGEVAENADSPENRRGLAQSHMLLAGIHEAAGSFEDAEAEYEAAGEIFENLAPEGCPAGNMQDLIQVYKAMGNCKLRQGLVEDSQPFFEESETVRKRLVSAAASAERRVRSLLHRMCE